MASLTKRGGKGNWQIWYFDQGGRRRAKSSGTTDKRIAQRIANKIEADIALRKHGVIDATSEAIAESGSQRVLDALEDFKAHKHTAGHKPRTIEDSISQCRQIIAAAGWAAIRDINADDVARYAAGMGGKPRTVAKHLASISAFTRWLWRGGKLSADPLAGIEKPSGAGEYRKRRMVLREEWPLIQAATLMGGERHGMAGAQRALLYGVAIQTGYRSSELRHITRGGLLLDRKPPAVRLDGRWTKNGQNATQYLTAGLAASLAKHAATLRGGSAVWPNMPRRENLARMFRADVAAARAAWLASGGDSESDFLMPINHEGEHLDFHSLRHTCGAWLAMQGAHIKAVQAVMRHSTITLTMDTYGHLFPGQEAATVALFGQMGVGW